MSTGESNVLTHLYFNLKGGNNYFMIKKKRVWNSPRITYQEFTPQEFIAACTKQLVGYKAYGSDIITGNLYYDRNSDGEYDRDNENVTHSSGTVPTGASSSSNSPYLPGAPTPLTGNYYTNYVTRYRFIIFFPYEAYTDQVSPIYKNGDIYFTDYDKVYNFS